MKKRMLTLLLCAAIMLCTVISPAVGESGYKTLAEGSPALEVLVYVATVAESKGYTVHTDSIDYDLEEGLISIYAGDFLISVVMDESQMAKSISIGAPSLNAQTAGDMGYIFGNTLGVFAGVEDISALAGIDWDMLDADEASTQIIVLGDCRMLVEKAPADTMVYRFVLELVEAEGGEASAQDRRKEAQEILGSMNAGVCAQFLYDEGTDLNGALGTEGMYYSKVNFALTSIAPDATANAQLTVDQGGSIEVFATAMDAVTRQNDVQSKKIRFFGENEICIVSGCALLRLSPALSAEEAGAIIAAFLEATAP